MEDVDVRRWYDNVARGSPATADVYLRRLGSFCKGFNTGPKALISLSEDDLYNLMLDYVSIMEKDGYAGGYIESTLKAVTIDDVESYLEQEWSSAQICKTTK